MIVFCVLISLVYAGMIATLVIISTPSRQYPKETDRPYRRFSVVVAARNEAQNIAVCLQSLLAQKYPQDHFEIIVVDDHSTDSTYNLIDATKGIKALSLKEGEGKKAALSLGIREAQYEYIATTDADCVAGDGWLRSLNSLFNRSGADLVTGPVKISPSLSILSAFEAMDAAITMVVTAFGIRQNLYYLANGANLAFTKKSYQSLGGYQSHQQYASGDDVFFYAEAARQGQKIAYADEVESMVTTKPQPGWKQLLQQRRRWATKTKAYAGRYIWMIQSTVAGVHFVLLALLLLGFIYPLAWKGVALLALVKMSIDFIALWKATGRQNNRQSLWYFIPGQIIYLYIILFSAWYALFPSDYKWKGRDVR